MTLRLATPSDAPALAGLASAFRNHLERQTPTDAQFLESVDLLLTGGDAEFFLASEEGVPVGYVLLRYRHSMWVSGLEATLEDLFVDPAMRGRGVGGRLVRFALDRAAEKGCVTACLDTNEHNAASTRIYTELGFSAHSKRWGGSQVFYRVALPRPA